MLYETQGGVALASLANPPANALSALVRRALDEVLERALSDPGVSLVVLSGSGRCFCAGIDLRELDGPGKDEPPSISDLVARIEAADKPVVAAIHGVALAGGFELALGCHYRVASADASVGLPQVKLGLMPSAGGTQRLPRVLHLEAALDIILSGEPITANDALALGVFDRLSTDTGVEAAIAMAAELPSRGPEALPRIRDREVKLRGGVAPADIVTEARRRIERRARGLIAPWACIDSVYNSIITNFDEALLRERQLFEECRDTAQSRAQRHLYFAERAATRPLRPQSLDGAASERSIGLVGCGTLGTGIAIACVNAGVRVDVLEVSDDAREKAFATIREHFETAVVRKRMSAQQARACLARIRPIADYDALGEANIVIEAVVEDLDTKRQVMQLLDKVCRPDAVLASCTMSIPIAELAAATERPQRVVGTRFFHPAQSAKLVEVVREDATSDDAVAAAIGLARRLGKLAVAVRACPGYVAGRLFSAMLEQACYLVEEGAWPHEVDKVLYDFGFPMGPFAQADSIGIDVSWRVRQSGSTLRRTGQRYSPLFDRLCELGRFGQRSGAGWYAYDLEQRIAYPDPETERLILERSAEIGAARRTLSEREILERCIFATIDEAARVLEEEIAERPGDVDVLSVYGFGFPIHRGGPLYYADEVGVWQVFEALRYYYDRLGDSSKPCEHLELLAHRGRRFHSR